MKKIVALVLALALALSLATVAFAANYSSESKSGTENSVTGYTVVNLEDNEKAAKVLKMATAGSAKETVDDDTVNYAFPEYFVSEYDSVFVLCDKDFADFRLFNNKGFVGYVVRLEKVATSVKFDGEFFAVGKLVAEGDEDECGAYKADTVEYSYFDATGKLYEEAKKVADGQDDAVEYVVVDGKLVGVATDAQIYIHNFKAADATYKATTNKDNKKLVAVKCSNCGKTFEVVTSLGKYDGDFLKMTIDGDGKAAFVPTTDAKTDDKTFNAAADTYYVLLGNAATAGTTTTVDSSKTFDAGVAMYVGLSLMSVAGSAVVIGKKKEF